MEQLIVFRLYCLLVFESLLIQCLQPIDFFQKIHYDILVRLFLRLLISKHKLDVIWAVLSFRLRGDCLIQSLFDKVGIVFNNLLTWNRSRWFRLFHRSSINLFNSISKYPIPKHFDLSQTKIKPTHISRRNSHPNIPHHLLRQIKVLLHKTICRFKSPKLSPVLTRKRKASLHNKMLHNT